MFAPQFLPKSLPSPSLKHYSSLFSKLVIALTSATLLSSFSASADTNTSSKPTLTVYSYDSFISEWGPGGDIKAGFESLCQCELVFKTPGSAANVVQAVKLEGHKSSADVLLGIDATLLNEALAAKVVIAHTVNWQDTPLDSPLDWQANDYQDSFVPFNYGYFNFIYRKDTGFIAPTSFEALLDSDAKIIIQDPRSSSPGMGLLLWIKALYGDNAQQAWQRIADNVLITTADWSQAYNMFLEGRGDMVLSYSTSPVYHQLVEQDETYQAAWFSEGHILQSEYAAIAASSKNKDLANAFLQYIVSPQGQFIIANKNWMLPIAKTDPVLDDAFSTAKNSDVPNIAIDSNAFSANRRAWINEYVFGMSGK